MLKSLEELRIQRELVQKHLDWLDKQIKQVEDLYQDRESTIKSDTPGLPPPSRELENSKNLKDVYTSDLSGSDINVIANEESEAAFLYENSDIKRTKFGCIAFFVIVTLLFLFLLFILPYMTE